MTHKRGTRGEKRGSMQYQAVGVMVNLADAGDDSDSSSAVKDGGVNGSLMGRK